MLTFDDTVQAAARPVNATAVATCDDAPAVVESQITTKAPPVHDDALTYMIRLLLLLLVQPLQLLVGTTHTKTTTTPTLQLRWRRPAH